MSTTDSIVEEHRERSRFVRSLVQGSTSSGIDSSVFARKPPKKLVQFWHDLDRLPEDVGECIESWSKVEEQGIERHLFGKYQARDFIGSRLGPRYRQAFDKCYHPAMQSDYFRLCYVLLEGGCYIDSDDAYDGAQLEYLFSDGRLKLQPLCYDVATDKMVPPSLFTKPEANDAGWIFYFNNNPLIACSEHPLIDRALAQATLSLENATANELPEIQSTTGPGNLTKTIFDAVNESTHYQQTILVLREWENIAINRWDLSYRHDVRNWRNSNCRAYKG